MRINGCQRNLLNLYSFALAKKPVSLRMNAPVHAAAKRRAKELGMNSLADYIEALIACDTAEGFDFVVRYSANQKPRHSTVIPERRATKKKAGRLSAPRAGRGGSRRLKDKGRSTDAPN